METAVLALLKKHWGYQALRPEQETIIAAVLKGQDVLALLPTAGGKSLCFQLPALYRPGLALVVSPLVALMHQQVADLQARHIAAAALDASLPFSEVQWTLRQAAAEQITCLYLSAERLQQESFVSELSALRLNLLVVDEAHCVSTWGHDFRPAYGRLGSLRTHFPELPLLALTATASPQVQTDIIKSLCMREPLRASRSLQRPNLSYSVFRTKQKARKLEQILGAVPGPALVYVPTRQSTQQWATRLQKAGLSAQGYHAGLSAHSRHRLQQRWMDNKDRILVATSAFGMGIDKADLCVVVHLYVPENLETYYQEAGRAGRRGQKAYAVLLYEEADQARALTLAANRIPDESMIRRVYQALGNCYKIAVGSGAYYSDRFDFDSFTATYRLPRTKTYYALQWLLCEGQVQLSDMGTRATRLRILVDKAALYRAEVAAPDLAVLTQALLRRYGGRLYHELSSIDESQLAEQLRYSRPHIQRQFLHAAKAGILCYLPAEDTPQITFLAPRSQASTLPLDTSAMRQRQKALSSAAEAVSGYLSATGSCREQILLAHFGESSPPCGYCDLCTRGAHPPE